MALFYSDMGGGNPEGLEESLWMAIARIDLVKEGMRADSEAFGLELHSVLEVHFLVC
jgi:hypothetical protein